MENITANAHVAGNRLYIMGLAGTDLGPIPFSYHCKLKGDVKDGPIDMTSDDQHPAIAEAIVGAQGPIMHTVSREKMKLGAENLVERARLGDQNAEGMLMMIGKAAKRDPKGRAGMAKELIRVYIKDHPSVIAGEPKPSFFGAVTRKVKQIARFGGVYNAIEEKLTACKTPMEYGTCVAAYVPGVGKSLADTMKAATVIANCKPITKEMVQAVAKAMPGYETAVRVAYTTSKDPKKVISLAAESPAAATAMQVGMALGCARRLQIVRDPTKPIRLYCEMAAWELGE